MLSYKFKFYFMLISAPVLFYVILKLQFKSLKHPDDEKHELNPELNSFLNFNLNPIKLCDCDGNKDFIFIYSFTRLNDFHIRQAIRQTWGSSLALFPNIKLAFILGTSNDYQMNLLIKNEYKLNGDIIQGNFADTYRNLTYKLLTSFKWISKYCTNAKFIVRIHGDMFLNTFNLMKFLQNQTQFFPQLKPNSKSFMCNIVRYNKIAYLTGKWLVTKEEHANILNGMEFLPDYCQGSFEIASTKIIKELFMKSYSTKVFFIDDAYEGLLANKIENVTYIHSMHYVINANQITNNTNNFLFIRTNVNVEDYFNIWNQLLKNYNKF